jgi:hypothetical protein
LFLLRKKEEELAFLCGGRGAEMKGDKEKKKKKSKQAKNFMFVKLGKAIFFRRGLLSTKILSTSEKQRSKVF